MQILKTITDWHPRPPFYYGWLVLGTAAIGAFIATGVAQTVLGGVQDLIAADMGWDRSTIAIAATAGTWISGLTMPIIGKLADRYGPRYMMVIAALIVGMSYIMLSNVNSIWQFYLAYIVARAIAGPNLQNVVPRTVAVNFFRKKRNLALGITALNRITGESLNIQVITLITGAFSWRMAYRILGLSALPLTIPLFLIMRKRPEDIGLLPDGDEALPVQSESGTASSTSDAGNFDWRVLEVVLVPAFWFIVWAEFLAVSTTGAIAFEIVPFLSDSGLSPTLAASALTVSIFLGGLSVPVWGYFSDKSTTKRLVIIALSATIVPTVLLLVTDTQSVGFYLVIIWGLLAGGLPIIGSMMIGQYFGRRSFGSITGLTGPFRTAAMGLGPTLGAMVFNLTDGYTVLFIMATVSYVLAIVLNYSVRMPRLPSRAQDSGA